MPPSCSSSRSGCSCRSATSTPRARPCSARSRSGSASSGAARWSGRWRTWRPCRARWWSPRSPSRPTTWGSRSPSTCGARERGSRAARGGRAARARGRARAGRLRGRGAGRVPRADVRAEPGAAERGGPGRGLALPRAGGRAGLDAEGGGHVLVELLPRSLFAAHPQRFPLAPDGRRSDLGNVCAASAAALAVVRERAAAALAALPGATDFHLWGLDLPGGGWCACPSCARLSPADQALSVCNAVAETLGAGTRVLHLAYHDTLESPRAVRPHPRVWAEFAPRERCYAHPLDDPACATNAPYRRALDAHLTLFAGRVHVFEYYGDAILFGGCAVPLAEVVQRDLDYYARAGVRGVSCLVFGQYSLWAYGVNVEAFARGAVSPAAAASARGTHAAGFGRAAEPVARYLAALERVMAGVVTYGDVLLPPAEAERAAAVRAALAAARRQAPELRRLLAAAPAARAAEQHLLEYTFAVLGALERWLAAADAEAREAALAALAGAVRHVRAAGLVGAGTWGLHDLEITHHFFAGALHARGAGQ